MQDSASSTQIYMSGHTKGTLIPCFSVGGRKQIFTQSCILETCRLFISLEGSPGHQLSTDYGTLQFCVQQSWANLPFQSMETFSTHVILLPGISQLNCICRKNNLLCFEPHAFQFHYIPPSPFKERVNNQSLSCPCYITVLYHDHLSCLFCRLKNHSLHSHTSLGSHFTPSIVCIPFLKSSHRLFDILHVLFQTQMDSHGGKFCQRAEAPVVRLSAGSLHCWDGSELTTRIFTSQLNIISLQIKSALACGLAQAMCFNVTGILTQPNIPAQLSKHTSIDRGNDILIMFLICLDFTQCLLAQSSSLCRSLWMATLYSSMLTQFGVICQHKQSCHLQLTNLRINFFNTQLVMGQQPQHSSLSQLFTHVVYIMEQLHLSHVEWKKAMGG